MLSPFVSLKLNFVCTFLNHEFIYCSAYKKRVFTICGCYSFLLELRERVSFHYGYFMTSYEFGMIQDL